MQNMKKLFFILALLLTTGSMQAQKQKEARRVLDATASAFEKGGGIQANFKAESFIDGNLQGSTNGEMRVDGEKFCLSTDETITWFDGKTQWSYVKPNDEVNISTPTPEELQTMNPYAFLRIYKKGFNYTVSNGSLRGKPTYEVILTAENKNQPIQEIRLDVEQKTYTPLCIRIRDNQTWTRIVIDNFKNRQKFGKDAFTFDSKAYPNAEVIDLQ